MKLARWRTKNRGKVSFDEGGKIGFEVFQTEPVWATIEEGSKAAYRATIGVYCALAFALSGKCINMALVQ